MPGRICISDFDVGEMTRLGAAFRRFGAGASTMEETASKTVSHIQETLVDARGAPACALVRLFKTHRYAGLPPDLQAVVRSLVPDVSPDLRSLTLLGSAGLRPEWTSRAGSAGHKVIPLASARVVREAPMIASLVAQLGLEASHVVTPQPGVFLEERATSFNVFHVENARGSPVVPAQDAFVVPYAVRSVVGFGGALLSGDIFALILFSRVTIPSDTAQLFRTLSLNLKLAIAPHERRVFA
jgi:hypothetical protein